MRAAMKSVTFDCTPVTPSTSGSITTTRLPATPSSADGSGTVEKRSFAAFRIASLRGIATGTGGGVGGGAGIALGLGAGGESGTGIAAGLEAGGGGGGRDVHAAINVTSTRAIKEQTQVILRLWRVFMTDTPLQRLS